MSPAQESKFRLIQKAFHSGESAKYKSTDTPIILTPMRMAMFAENPKTMDDVEVTVTVNQDQSQKTKPSYPSIDHMNSAGINLMYQNLQGNVLQNRQ